MVVAQSTEKVLPINLRTLDGTIIGYKHITHENCVYFSSYQNFGVKIIGGNGKLFSVLQLQDGNGDNYLETTENQMFTDKPNFGYTLFIPVDGTSVLLECTSIENVVTHHVIELRLDNVASDDTQHYDDLLVNNYLPKFEEIKSAILVEFNSQELIKRLLLDFRSILCTKGTKRSVESFFNFIGFNHESLTVLNEYLKGGIQNTTSSNLNKTQVEKASAASLIDFNLLTTTPDKTKDTKTGNYWIEFDNYDEVGLDANNLPIRNFRVQNLEDFFTKLPIIIALSNRYFTLLEENITFFGLHYSSNIALEQSITSNMSVIFANDCLHFRKQLHINMNTFIDVENTDRLIDNCVQIKSELSRTEVKFIISELSDLITQPDPILTKLFFVEQELFDDELIGNESLESIYSLFGTILHLNVISPETWVEINIHGTQENLIRFKKQYVTDPIALQIALTDVDVYTITVDVWDEYNNKEQYFYDFNVTNSSNRIDFDILNTSELIMIDMLEFTPDNGIDLDIASPSITSNPGVNSNNFILSLDAVPENLQDYYLSALNGNSRWLSDNKKFILPAINRNFKLDSISETISVELSEQWIQILTLPYSDQYKLMIKYYNAAIAKNETIECNDIREFLHAWDKVFITLMDINDPLNSGTAPDVSEIQLGCLYNGFVEKDARKITSTDAWRPAGNNREDYWDLMAICGGTQTGVDGDILKEAGNQYWSGINTGYNSFGFNLRPNGMRFGANFSGKGTMSYLGVAGSNEWSWDSMLVVMEGNQNSMWWGGYGNGAGMGMRLVRDILTARELTLNDGEAGDPYFGNNNIQYRTVKIGNKIWLADNLCETKWRTGEPLENLITEAQWSGASDNSLPGYCDYDNDPTNSVLTVPGQSIPTIPTYFITTMETGIDLNKNTFDFVLVDKVTEEETSIYDHPELISKFLPINYDIPLFIRPSVAVPDFNHYMSEPEQYFIIYIPDTNDTYYYPRLKSMFPRFSMYNGEYLKLSDVIVGKINRNYIVSEKDIKWSVINSFTGEVLFTTTDYTLKYRINNNICYTIKLEFKIGEQSYSIVKDSIISSYTKSYFN